MHRFIVDEYLIVSPEEPLTPMEGIRDALVPNEDGEETEAMQVSEWLMEQGIPHHFEFAEMFDREGIDPWISDKPDQMIGIIMYLYRDSDAMLVKMRFSDFDFVRPIPDDWTQEHLLSDFYDDDRLTV